MKAKNPRNLSYWDESRSTAVEQNLTDKIAAWTEGNFEEAALIQAIETAADDAANHRTGFGTVVEGLTPSNRSVARS
jgi:hypothetical protein